MNNSLPPQGFRLSKLELLNWGTFDQKIWSIEPDRESALLTGANGSGKSTLVDALLTLLVPSRGRNYNQAAGASKKKERSEQSYVRGAYGKIQQEGEYVAKEQYLRPKDTFSVLLAIFSNGQRQVTIAQFFWYQDSLNKFFVVAQRPLTIQEHFVPQDTIRTFKKQLRTTEGVQLFDQFQKYSKAFRKQLSLQPKAIDLFNQTVTIKEIGNLNSFVRQHMLEVPPTKEKIKGFIENFDNLDQAYKALQKARQQLNLLQPIVNLGDRFEAIEAEINALQTQETAVPAYFAQLHQQLLQAALDTAEQDLNRERNSLTAVQAQLTQLREQERDLDYNIRHDQVGQQLRDLERDLTDARKTKQAKQVEAARYNELAQEFDLAPITDKTAFHQAQQTGASFRSKIANRLQQRQDDQGQWQIKQDQLARQKREINDELDSLRQRPSQIPAKNLRLRRALLDELAIPEHEIPFIGELLRVKENEKLWTGAIERLLHNFGLRLLVPAKHYDPVVNYVRQTHLGGRIVFHRIPSNYRGEKHTDLDPTSLFHKIRIKPETPFRPWVEEMLAKQYNYLCCPDQASFNRARRAITAEGLIKSGQDRHEKDDRTRINDRRNFILGWNNQEKISALEEDLAQTEQELRSVRRDLSKAQKEVTLAIQKQERLERFLRFTDYTTIDWQTAQAHIDSLNAKQQALTASSNKLQALKDQLVQVQQSIAQTDQSAQQLQGTIGRLDYQIKTYHSGLKKCAADIAKADKTLITQLLPALTKLHHKPTLNTVNDIKGQVEKYFSQTIRKQQTRSQGLSNNLVGQIRSYKAQYPMETADVDGSIKALPAFRDMHAQVTQDDLPQYESRFKSLQDEKIVQHVTTLQSEFDMRREEIEEKIDLLNRALRAIDYTENTYIQLQATPNLDTEIRTFRQDLRACIPNLGNPDYESSFQQTKKLIDRFKDDLRWTNKVTDVRQWIDFSASERYRADDSERHYYSDSSGKSGGQKAKLAYTILASAISYQYGLSPQQKNHDKFSFVVVDEAFSRSDENNARYAMRLFKELGLQLLVVTPLTGIHIVEPYVSACHFVQNNSDGNQSIVRTLSIEDHIQARKAREQTAH